MTIAAENHEVAPRETWLSMLGSAAAEVLSMMAGITVTIERNQDAIKSHVTGTVGIAGAISAIFSLRCSEAAATRIAAQMLAVPPEQAAAQHCDAVGEVCNMVAGHFKAKIGLGDKCMLSVPTVITGSDYSLHRRAGTERLGMQLLDGEERMEITLDIRQ